MLTACSAATIQGYQVPGADLATDTTWFIIFNPDDERSTHELIRSSLAERGIDAMTGFEDRIPGETRVLVRYGAQWSWDVTWYLLELDLRLYDAEDGLLLASGASRRHSLARRSPAVVVGEVLDSIVVDQ